MKYKGVTISEKFTGETDGIYPRCIREYYESKKIYNEFKRLKMLMGKPVKDIFENVVE